MLGRLRINRFYEIVGIDTLMHTMSDQIGENDDFDRESRNFQSQNEIFRQKYKKQINENEEENDIVQKAGHMFQNGDENQYTQHMMETEIQNLIEEEIQLKEESK